MQTVSAEWKAEQRKNVRSESFLELQYAVTDPAVQADAKTTATHEWVNSKAPTLTDGLDRVFIPYPVLEANSWLLDGSREYTSAGTEYGYVTDYLSGDDCTFKERPVISIGFSAVHNNVIPGLTITFSTAFGEYATDFIVRAYNGSTKKAELSVTGNTEVSRTVFVDMVGFNKIEIEIVKWNVPHHRARAEKLLLGVEKTYTKSEVISFSNNMSVDLVSAELPKFEIVFELDNVGAQWNPYNPEGTAKYLIKRQEITVRYGFKIGEKVEWIKGGSYFMSEWDTPTNGITATFTARDVTEYMTDQFDKTKVGSSVTLYALCDAAFTQSKIPLMHDGSNRWVLDDSLKNITVTVPTDFKYTNAEVVQLCANAAKCVMWQDRDGKFHVAPFVAGNSDYVIDEFLSYANLEEV